MKTFALLLVSVVALGLGGCATDDSLASDEEYKANREAAPNAPDPTGHIPQRSQYPMTGGPRY